MDSYLTLLIVPLLCVPIQNLYLASGQRYDLGSITYIATGTLLAAQFTDPSARQQTTLLLVLLIVLSIVAYLARCFILATGSPKDFTLFTFGQAWAVSAVVGYEIEQNSQDGGSGVYVHLFQNLTLPIALASLLFAILTTALLVRSRISLRLVAFTEAPLQYRFVFGSLWWLAWRIETCALLLYVVAGVAFRFVISDISGQTFGVESLWCLLSAAVIGRNWQMWVVCGPIAVTVARLFANQFVDSQYSLLLVYSLLALCLAIVNFNAKRASREITG